MKNKVIEILDEMILKVLKSDDPYELDLPDYRNNPTACLYETKSRIQSLPDDDWIAVTDRLPTMQTNVIISGVEIHTLGWYYPTSKKWYSIFTTGPVEVEANRITHWQHLPPPPIQLPHN